MKTTYKASLDKLAKGITIFITLLFALIIIGQFSIIKSGGIAIPICTIVGCLIIYFSVFSLRPINYEINNNDLVIHRFLKDVTISKKLIKNIKVVDTDIFKRCIRTFGVGGFFGYFGKFSNAEFGKMTWYATRKDKIVIITTTSDKIIVLTPNEPGKFVENMII